MKHTTILLLAVVAAAQATGCYNTKLNTQGAGVPAGPEIENRQWFTIGGLVPISGETARECSKGIAEATSREGGVDILIRIALTAGGLLLGPSVCNLADNPTPEQVSAYSLCSSAVAGIPPLLLGSRTVTYRCRQ